MRAGLVNENREMCKYFTMVTLALLLLEAQGDFSLVFSLRTSWDPGGKTHKGMEPSPKSRRGWAPGVLNSQLVHSVKCSAGAGFGCRFLLLGFCSQSAVTFVCLLLGLSSLGAVVCLLTSTF